MKDSLKGWFILNKTVSVNTILKKSFGNTVTINVNYFNTRS